MPFNYPWSLHVIVWLLLVPLSITGIRGKTTVLEGDNLQLICEVLSREEPKIARTKEKPGNQGNTGVVQEGKVLTITNINRTDVGNYTCTADNGFGKPEDQTAHCSHASNSCIFIHVPTWHIDYNWFSELNQGFKPVRL